MFYLRATYCKTEVILFQEREKISLPNEFSCAEKVKFPSFFLVCRFTVLHRFFL